MTVTYHDMSLTFDYCMRVVNENKTTNASILLADGATLSAPPSYRFKDTTGMLGAAFRAMKAARGTIGSTSNNTAKQYSEEGDKIKSIDISKIHDNLAGDGSSSDPISLC